MLECVINVSEGRREAVIEAIAGAAGEHLLDAHSDFHHHRTVLTLAGPDVEAAALSVARTAIELIDLGIHDGVHPRLGAVDVVPFVPLPGTGSGLGDAVAARDRSAARLAHDLDLPCFLYGPERSLPDVRRGAFRTLSPDVGPDRPHPTAGAACVGARPLLLAYNLWLAPRATLADAQRIAAEIRSDGVRALGLQVGSAVQVSCNLIDPFVTGPGAVFDAVVERAPVARAELVGLAPARIVEAEPSDRWSELDLSMGEGFDSDSNAAASTSGRCRPGTAPASQGAGPADAAAFPLAQPAPDPELLAVRQRVLETFVFDDAASAHLFGFSC